VSARHASDALGLGESTIALRIANGSFSGVWQYAEGTPSVAPKTWGRPGRSVTNTSTGDVWDSLTAAAISNGVSVTRVCAWIRRGNFGGIWRYA
jgi:hypothetical protein